MVAWQVLSETSSWEFPSTQLGFSPLGTHSKHWLCLTELLPQNPHPMCIPLTHTAFPLPMAEGSKLNVPFFDPSTGTGDPIYL